MIGPAVFLLNSVGGRMSAQVDVQVLARLHRILRQQTDLNDRIRRGPAKIEVACKAEADFAAQLEAARKLLAETRMNADRKQLQLQEREARIDDLKGKRNACESNREYQLLNDQIAADEQANSVQSDEILELLMKLDDVEARVQEARSRLEKGQAETARVRKQVEQDLASLEDDLKAVNQELAETESLLPADIRAEYRRLVKALGEDALAVVDDNSCGHCYTTVTTQLLSELMMKRATFCKRCGSLLYLSENAAV
jgi:predicted  nucleic acid-binding Zn-ribbon protein